MTNHDLAALFRKAATHLECSPLTTLPLWNVKFYLLAALNDLDRELDYGNPGRGIDDLLEETRQ